VPGDRVALLAGNSHVMLAGHYAVPFAGAVLVPLNIRATAADIAYILDHAGCSVLIYDQQYEDTAVKAPSRRTARCGLIRNRRQAGRTGAVDRGRRAHCVPVSDERGLLAINYTSGTPRVPRG